MLEFEDELHKDYSFVHNGETLNVTLPDYLIPVVNVQHKTHYYYNNIEKFQICKLCGVNMTKLRLGTSFSWVLTEVCGKCKGEMPCLLVHVSTVAGFPHCEQKFWFNFYQGLKEPAIKAALEGTIAHSLNEFLVNYLSKFENTSKIKHECGISREKILSYLTNLLDLEYDKIAEDIVRRQREDFGDKVELKDILELKEELFEDFINDFAYLYTIRIYQNLVNGGVYHNLLAKRWTEMRVMAYDVFFGIKFLQIGRVDALYKLSDNSFFIRDGKSSRRITSDAIKEGFWDFRYQAGGYSHCLKQIYPNNVSVFAMVYLLRYHDLIPDVCDEEGYLNNLQKMAELILYKQPPKKADRGGLCSTEFCLFWGFCQT